MAVASRNASKLRGRAISPTAPTDGQALAWSASSKLWLPTSVAGTIGAGSIGSTQLAPSTIQYATVAITAAQIKALSSAPVTLVAAQGAGTLIEFVSAMFNIVAGTLYVNGAGGAPALTIAPAVGTGSAQWVDNAASGLAFCLKTNLGGNSIAMAIATISGASSFASSFAVDVAGGSQNQPLQFGQTGGATKDLVTGTGTISARIAYRVHSGLS